MSDLPVVVTYLCKIEEQSFGPWEEGSSFNKFSAADTQGAVHTTGRTGVGDCRDRLTQQARSHARMRVWFFISVLLNSRVALLSELE